MPTKAESRLDDPLPRTEKGTKSIESLLSKARQNLEKATSLQKKKRVLIVDDNAYIREVLRRLLEQKGFKVFTAADGRAGIDTTKSETPDLILVDVQMPRIDGVEMIKTLRAQTGIAQVPILAITAYGHWAEARAMEAGADRAMVKPLDPDMLLECIDQLLEESH